MADSISIAGKPIPKNALFIGGAVAAGILGYAYWKRTSGGGGTGTSPTDTSATDSGIDPSTGQPYADEFGAGMNYTGLGTYDPATGAILASYGSQTVTAVSTNAQWAQAAQAYLVSQSYDAQAVSAAIGKVLAGLPVTNEEATIWAAAVGYEGQPPNYVPPLVHVPASGQTGTTSSNKPGWAYNLKATHVTRNSIHVTWSGVANVQGYKVALNGQTQEAVFWQNYTFNNLKPNTTYTIAVTPFNKSGDGPTSHASVRTSK